MSKRRSKTPGTKTPTETGAKKSTPRASMAPNEKLIGRAIIGSRAPKRER